MRNYVADIYFQDEAPRLGCGWRRCAVKVGRKWVRLVERATGYRQKLPLKTFAQLTRQREVAPAYSKPSRRKRATTRAD